MVVARPARIQGFEFQPVSKEPASVTAVAQHLHRVWTPIEHFAAPPKRRATGPASMGNRHSVTSAAHVLEAQQTALFRELTRRSNDTAGPGAYLRPQRPASAGAGVGARSMRPGFTFARSGAEDHFKRTRLLIVIALLAVVLQRAL
jgi:hypothetical protein